jgi:SET domain
MNRNAEESRNRQQHHERQQEKEDDDDAKHETYIYDVGQLKFRIGFGAKGRGLFASCEIPPFTRIHVAPCIRVDEQEYESYMKHTVLEHYVFNEAGKTKLVALGYGSLFNHSSKEPNVNYKVDSANLCIAYSTSYKTIYEGEELCISYGTNLWFDDADASISDDNNDHKEYGNDIVLDTKVEKELNVQPCFLSDIEL